MIYGIGTDLIEVERVRAMFERHGDRARNRLLTESEQEGSRKFADPYPHLAGRFAAKEAVLKALGTGLIGSMRWRDIEIGSDNFGRPVVNLSGDVQAEARRRKIAKIHLSISHTSDYATAYAVAETPDSGPPENPGGNEPADPERSINK
jgi:holo-[acyl-carrier protein] synthase